MHINVEPGDDHVVLHIRGEFDTFYCHLLEEEIAAIQKNGIHNAVLNLRLVKFINSTALGAIIKASKALGKEGGKLVIARPSAFCRDIIEKVGLDRVVPVADSDEDAIHMLKEGLDPVAPNAQTTEEQDPSSVIFRLVDSERLRHFVEQAAAKNPFTGTPSERTGLASAGCRASTATGCASPGTAARPTSRPSTWARCSLWARNSS